METKQQRALISEVKSDPGLTEAFTMPTLAWPTIAILLISFGGLPCQLMPICRAC